MKLKEGVNIQGLDIRMRTVLIAAEKLWEIYGHELVITSGLEGEHSAGSLHYYGLAVDFRTNYFSREVLGKISHLLRIELGRCFDVILYETHIHVEYDPK